MSLTQVKDGDTFVEAMKDREIKVELRERVGVTTPFQMRNSRKRDGIVVDWPAENPDVVVKLSEPAHQQTVLQLVEKAHTIERIGLTTTVYVPKHADPAAHGRQALQREHRTDVLGPLGTRARANSVKVTARGNSAPWEGAGYYYDVKGNITWHMPDARTSFLTGMDETANFISILPQNVTTVERAHDVLRPRGVPAGTLRQGEFFFVPVPENKQVAIWTAIRNQERRNRRANFQFLRKPTDWGWTLSDHQVTTGWFLQGRTLKGQFVTGVVQNSRHRPLVLNGLHQVFVNREVGAVQTNARQASYD